jgi:deazaflavin-dependent oxidoreductase (nitroreductase family)
MNSDTAFRKPSFIEKFFNHAFGVLVGLGLGLRHNYLLQVRGRKTGRLYSTPVNVLELRDRLYLVAPRGQTQWVRNARVSGEITLKKGARQERYRLRELNSEEKPEILKAYLESFKTTVQRYFPIPAGSPVEAFTSLAAEYPAFELQPSE